MNLPRFNNPINKLSFRLFRRCVAVKLGYHHDAVSNKKSEKEYVQLHKSRGQHLLVNPRVLDAIISLSAISPNDTVLEIGPGTGNLTLKLLATAKKVVAIEIDKRMVDILRKRAVHSGFQDRLEIICGDALKIDFPEFDLVVANIPYGISSPLLAKLIFGANANPFRCATLMLQKEFARRLVAKPGDSEFNRLAVNLNMCAEVEVVMDVSKRDFIPCPKVDSSVIRIYPKPEIPEVDLEEWWAFTRTCFGKKNKTLGAMFKQKKKLTELMRLSKSKGLTRDGNGKHDEADSNLTGDGACLPMASETDVSLFRGKIIGVLESNEFLEKRPSKLSNVELLRLLSLLNQAGIYFHGQE